MISGQVRKGLTALVSLEMLILGPQRKSKYPNSVTLERRHVGTPISSLAELTP